MANDRDTNPKGRGFQLMSKDRRSAIARLGGIEAHRRGNAHEWDSDEAREAASSRKDRMRNEEE